MRIAVSFIFNEDEYFEKVGKDVSILDAINNQLFNKGLMAIDGELLHDGNNIIKIDSNLKFEILE